MSADETFERGMDNIHERMSRESEESRRPTKQGTFREVESRENSMREADMRWSIAVHEQGKLRFDPRKIPEGKKYMFVAESIYDQPDISNLQNAYDKGARPVPASRHPETILPEFGGPHERKNNGFIRMGGQIVMEMEIVRYEEYQQYFVNKAKIREGRMKTDKSISVGSELSVALSRNSPSAYSPHQHSVNLRDF